MEQEYKLEQTAKVIVGAVVFGMLVKNAMSDGLMNELKDLKMSDLGDAMAIVPKIVNALKGNDAVAALADAGADPFAQA